MKDISRPLIAVTAGNAPDSPGRRELYGKSLEAAGGDGVFLLPGEDITNLSLRYDGFVFPGGRDLDPSWYGEGRLPQTVLEEAERTRFEFSLLDAIMREEKPVLGICYGMQLINVFFKGSLFQDVGEGIIGSLNHTEGDHPIEITDNPYLRPRHCDVNSSHHQAVRQIGKGLETFAVASDGVVEGVYRADYVFLVGVQWHPERMQSPLTAELFGRFIDACRKR